MNVPQNVCGSQRADSVPVPDWECVWKSEGSLGISTWLSLLEGRSPVVYLCVGQASWLMSCWDIPGPIFHNSIGTLGLPECVTLCILRSHTQRPTHRCVAELSHVPISSSDNLALIFWAPVFFLESLCTFSLTLLKHPQDFWAYSKVNSSSQLQF